MGERFVADERVVALGGQVSAYLQASRPSWRSGKVSRENAIYAFFGTKALSEPTSETQRMVQQRLVQQRRNQ